MTYKVAGIDIHKKVLMVVVTDAAAEEFTDSLRPWRYAKRLTGLSALVCPDLA